MSAAVQLLSDLIRYPSLSGRERDVMAAIAGAFEDVADEVERVAIPPSIVADPDYCDPLPGLDYTDRYNLRIVCRGSGGGRRLIVNTHADVVPAPKGAGTAFVAALRDGFVWGRGACDAKGQIVTLWSALKELRSSGARLRGDVIAHIVVEEENGGNGTLALVRRGERADAAVVLEPTGLRLVTSGRGAVWFRIKCRGRAGHVGSATRSISALRSAISVMEALQAYHDELLAQSRQVPLFEGFEDPMPIVFGKLAAGEWPATVPDDALLEGVLGFLPNRRVDQVMAEMKAAISARTDAWTRDHTDLAFTYRHEPLVTAPGAPISKAFADAIRACGGEPAVAAMPASSDAWLYASRLGIPTVLFGPGELADAHSDHERVSIHDLERGASMLATFIRLWAG